MPRSRGARTPRSSRASGAIARLARILTARASRHPPASQFGFVEGCEPGIRRRSAASLAIIYKVSPHDRGAWPFFIHILVFVVDRLWRGRAGEKM